MARSVLRSAWGRLNFGALSRALDTAFAALNAMTLELYYKDSVFQTSAPLTGATVVLTDAVNDAHLVVTPAATIAACTFTVPTNANSRIGQRITITTSQIITSVTISGSGITIVGAPTTLAAGGYVTLQKVAASTWRRVA